jgi:hypothetical protein
MPNDQGQSGYQLATSKPHARTIANIENPAGTPPLPEEETFGGGAGSGGSGVEAYGGLTPDEFIADASTDPEFGLGTGWDNGGVPVRIFRWGRALVFPYPLQYTGSDLGDYGFETTPMIKFPERWLPYDATWPYEILGMPGTKQSIPGYIVDSGCTTKTLGFLSVLLNNYDDSPAGRGLRVDNDLLPSWTGEAGDVLNVRIDVVPFFLLPPNATLDP